MKKILGLVLILCLVIFSGCTTKSTNIENTTSTTKQPLQTEENENSLSQTNEDLPTIEENLNIENTTIEQKYKIEDLKNTNKELIIYGDTINNIDNIKEKLSSYNKNISVVIYALDGDFGLVYNTNQTYFSACTIKIGYVLSCCKQIDEGKESKDTVLTYQQKHYHGGSGQIKNQPYGTKYTIATLIDKCLSISDNVAYEMLVDHFGYEYYNQMVNDIKCESIKLNGLWASKAKTLDFVKLWNSVNEYFETETEMSKVLKNACTNTSFNYGTKTISGVDYSHKSGDNFGTFAAYNDAGIVWCEKPYIYVVFTNSEGTTYDTNVVNTVMRSIFDDVNSSSNIDKTEKTLYN